LPFPVRKGKMRFYLSLLGHASFVAGFVAVKCANRTYARDPAASGAIGCSTGGDTRPTSMAASAPGFWLLVAFSLLFFGFFFPLVIFESGPGEKERDVCVR
jgi:hypothetical protein